MKLLKDRKEYYAYFKEKLKESCAKYNEKVLETKENSISLGITLSRYKDLSEEKITQLGGVLYSYKVMGSRVLTKKEKKKFCGIEFSNYGSHIENYSELPYMTVACAIGMKKEEIDEFIKKLEESFKELWSLFD